ncbi:hypothetical protein [Streptomyces sp. NPDC057494]|uniref:hypothetical protein n=1 Tax=Streptomyces sp. NPDC057494 TaxID=3346148 RepID=UPI003688E4E5
MLSAGSFTAETASCSVVQSATALPPGVALGFGGVVVPLGVLGVVVPGVAGAVPPGCVEPDALGRAEGAVPPGFPSSPDRHAVDVSSAATTAAPAA